MVAGYPGVDSGGHLTVVGSKLVNFVRCRPSYHQGERQTSSAPSTCSKTTLDGKVLPLHASQSNFRNASHIYEVGTTFCPDSVHLFHSWAMHENSLGNIDKARS